MKDVRKKRNKQMLAATLSSIFFLPISLFQSTNGNHSSALFYGILGGLIIFGFIFYMLDKSAKGHWEYEPHTEEEIDEMFRTASENEKKRDLERQEELYKLTELCTACKQNKDYFMSSKTLPDCPQLKDSRRIECQTLKDLINRLQTVG